jgi:hypothetical protein
VLVCYYLPGEGRVRAGRSDGILVSAIYSSLPYALCFALSRSRLNFLTFSGYALPTDVLG